MWWPKGTSLAPSHAKGSVRCSSAPHLTRASLRDTSSSDAHNTNFGSKTWPGFGIKSPALPTAFPSPSNSPNHLEKAWLSKTLGGIESRPKRLKALRQRSCKNSANQACAKRPSTSPRPRPRRTNSLPKLDVSPKAPEINLHAEAEQVYVLRLRRELNIPMEAMRQARDLFRKHADMPTDEVRDGILRKPGFAKLWLEMTHRESDDGSHVPSEIWQEALRHAGQWAARGLDFGQFATWFSSRYFCEDVSLDRPKRRLRSVARQHSMHHNDVERYKQMFNKFDADGNGTIDREEFEKLLYQCTKMPHDIELPAARIENLWNFADDDGNQEIKFDEFLSFYKTYLGKSSTGFEDFYSPKRHSVVA